MFTTLFFIFINEVSLGITMLIDSQQSAADVAVLDNIQYSFYDYHVNWEEARILCLGHKSELAILNSERKAIFVTHQIFSSSSASTQYWIGSRLSFRKRWIWIKDDEILDAKLFFRQVGVVPKYNNQSLVVVPECLTLFRRSHSIPMFIPLRCQQRRPFICQRDKMKLEANITESLYLKFENRYLYLYSASSTWFEAVVECRQRNQQIADVTSLSLAQSLAAGMLRVRPRAVEDAWISGYLKNRIWVWLPTDMDISRNELWQDENMASGNCLLLDRHTCNQPTYVSAKCDRRRSFLCQTIPEGEVVDQPVSAVIDECQYWIGTAPKNWSEASQSCKELNASLVTLDSQLRVDHIMYIMIDNRDLLQHVWIDGRRVNEKSGRYGYDRVWIWESTGELIPGPGTGFNFWCNDSASCLNAGDCLNMDTEDFAVPLVYSLDCKNKQLYLCQSWSINCEKKIRGDKTLFASYDQSKANATPVGASEINSLPNGIRINPQDKIMPRSFNDRQDLVNHLNISTKILNTKPSENFENDGSRNTSITRLDSSNAENSARTDTTVLGFKDLIELMVKNIRDKGLKYNSMPSVDEESEQKTMKIHLIKENVSRIVQSTINKNTQISTLSLRSPSPKTQSSDMRKSLNSELKFGTTSRDEKSSEKSTVDEHERENFFVKDPEAMFKLGHAMKSIFANENFNPPFETEDAAPKSKVVIPTRSQSVKKSKVSDTVQILNKNTHEVSEKMKLAEITEALKTDLKNVDPIDKKIVLTESRNKNVNSWNIVLGHILDSMNNGTEHTKRMVRFSIKHAPET